MRPEIKMITHMPGGPLYDFVIRPLSDLLKERANRLEVHLGQHHTRELDLDYGKLTTIILRLGASLSTLTENSVVTLKVLSQCNGNSTAGIEVILFTQVNDLQGSGYKAGYSNECLRQEIGHDLAALNGSLAVTLRGGIVTYRLTSTMALPNDHITVVGACLSGKTALVVEDNKLTALVFSTFLEECGVETAIAANGLIAIQMAAAGNYDIILMDIDLPLLNGIEVTKQVRHFNKGKAVIIGLTASTDQLVHCRMKEVGAVECLLKPVSGASLIICLSKYLGQQRSSAPMLNETN